MKNENIKHVDIYKFVFITNGKVTVAIESEDKINAIEIFKNEYPKLFEVDDFRMIKLDREITIDNHEKLYL